MQLFTIVFVFANVKQIIYICNIITNVLHYICMITFVHIVDYIYKHE